ncbi:Ankyrin repeat-containing domain [Cinara cedri]|uniref:Ankyrin repeat-containing domain n=1 Tax=Cinara cedri TaxID=506608 RepID=A0A5E4ND54_9HEMI|nr:Ankyrin repeat-containing domain [Cinara cedri]
MKQQLTLEISNYEGFVRAARDDDTSTLDNLWEKAESLGVEQQLILEKDDYAVFVLAAFGGHTDTLDSLWEKAKSLSLQRKMLEVDSYKAFALAASNGHVYALDNLWKKAGSLGLQREMLKANSYRAFILAASSGHTNTLDSLWEKAKLPDIQQEMLRADSYRALILAAFGGRIDTLDNLWRKAKLPDIQGAMLAIGNYEAFRAAASNGHNSTLDNLWEKAKPLGLQSKMLKADSYRVFTLATENGHTSTLDNLWEKAKSLGLQQKMLKVGDYYAFKTAAKNGHNDILDNLWEKARSLRLQYEMLKANSYEVFREAARNNKIATLANSHFMLEITDQEWKECLKAIASFGDKGVFDSVWQNLVSSLRFDTRQEINELHRELKQGFLEIRELKTGPFSRYELQFTRSKRTISNEEKMSYNLQHKEITNSATKSGSSMEGLLNLLKAFVSVSCGPQRALSGIVYQFISPLLRAMSTERLVNLTGQAITSVQTNISQHNKITRNSSSSSFLSAENISVVVCVAEALGNTSSKRYQGLKSQGVNFVPSIQTAVNFARKEFDSFVEDKIKNLDSKEKARIRTEIKNAYPEIIESFRRGVEFSGNIGLDDALKKCKKCFCTNILSNNVNPSESQMLEKIDNKPETCLNDPIIYNQLQRLPGR